MSITIEFYDVGAAKKTFRATMEELSEIAMFRAVKKAKALASKGIDFEQDESGLSGTVLAGYRTAGYWKVIENAQDPSGGGA